MKEPFISSQFRPALTTHQGPIRSLGGPAPAPAGKPTEGPGFQQSFCKHGSEKQPEKFASEKLGYEKGQPEKGTHEKFAPEKLGQEKNIEKLSFKAENEKLGEKQADKQSFEKGPIEKQSIEKQTFKAENEKLGDKSYNEKAVTNEKLGDKQAEKQTFKAENEKLRS
ncbi:MAG: hypothetical protein AB7S38_42400, partial [Vulcanimicrobiota bacterium]